MSKRSSRIRCLSALLLALASLSSSAEPMGREINPGVLGPNALPVLPSERPWVRPGLSVSLGWAGQLSTPVGGVDRSMLVPFRLEFGLFRRVSFSADGSPFEIYSYSPESRAAWAPSRPEGVTRGDVRLATKVLLFSDDGWRPATAVRVTLKTATGEDLHTRRFIDAPAYQFDALAAWRLRFGAMHLEAWLLVGFFAWQQGAAGQNDAVTWAGTVSARWPLVVTRLEGRGYVGWLRDDKPVALSGAVELSLTPVLDVIISATRTFRDPATFELAAALRFTVSEL